MEDRPDLVRFDWAMKRLLRDKANFGVLEGFLTSLLGFEIKIDRILESESNKESAEQKLNRVDILAETTDGTKMLIEVQNQSEVEYFHRILFGTARLIADYTRLGETYGKISKIYSINIVYFRLGEGTDYVYRGTTRFTGLHDGKELRLSERWKEKLRVEGVEDIFPTYYILRINDFDEVAKTPLQQWLHFLKHGSLPENADAPGMEEVRKKLRLDRLSKEEQLNYRKLLDDRISIRNGFEEARDEGLQQGLQQGRVEERQKMIEAVRNAGLSEEMIRKILG